LVDVGGILVVDHIIGICDLTILITNDWERQITARDLIDILDPSSVGLNGVGGYADQLDATLGELRLKLCESTELSCADWGVVFWVREQDHPFIADELMEVDRTIGGFGLEVGCNGTQTEGSWSLFSRHLLMIFDRVVLGIDDLCVEVE